MTEPDLARFASAQAGVYAGALAELRRGRKESHWMWFVFPQLKGLGRSPTSAFYGIASLGEARAYLRHPLLGPRLRECTEAVLSHAGAGAEAVFGAVKAQFQQMAADRAGSYGRIARNGCSCGRLSL